MAKSLRSKTKRTFRRIKREDSAYSVAHAARLDRLSSKLAIIKEQAPPVEEEGRDESEDLLDKPENANKMELDTINEPFDIKIKTSGARATRRGLRKMHKAQEKNRSKNARFRHRR